MPAIIAQNLQPSIGSGGKALAPSMMLEKNSERLSTFGCSRNMFDSMVEPQRPVPTMKVDVLIRFTNPSVPGLSCLSPPSKQMPPHRDGAAMPDRPKIRLVDLCSERLRYRIHLKDSRIEASFVGSHL